MAVSGQQLEVAIQRRGQRQATDHRFALAVNCTGPLGSISQSADALLKGLKIK